MQVKKRLPKLGIISIISQPSHVLYKLGFVFFLDNLECMTNYSYSNSSGSTHLLLLRFMTLSFCMSPISSGKDSSLLEWRNSTVAFFQLPICKGKEWSSVSKHTHLRKRTDGRIAQVSPTSGGSWTRKLWSAAKVRMPAHWPMEEGRASISLKLQSSSSRDVSLTSERV